jgi:hypothetical protein
MSDSYISGKERFISVQDAVVEYQRSRVWFYMQTKSGVLTKYRSLGTKTLYLSREEIENLIAIRPVQEDTDEVLEVISYTTDDA